MKIKNILLITCMCLFALTAKAQSKSFQLSGNVKGVVPFTSVHVYMLNEKESYYKADVVNNSFVLKGEVSEPTVCKFIFGGTRQFIKGTETSFIPYKCSYLWLVVSPNDKLEIKGDLTGKDFADIYYRGNEANRYLSDLMSSIFPTLNLHGRNAVLLMKNKDLSAEKIKEIRNEQNIYSEKEAKARLDFLNKSYNSIAGLWLMDDMLIRSQIEFDELIPIFNKVDKKKFSKSQYFISVNQRIKAHNTITVGSKCPEIISNESFDNKLIKLSDFKGKYVILDFWGTWCGSCIAGMPAMKAFRDKNVGKVEILGIAKDSNKPLWRKIITDKGMNWPNILSGVKDKDFVSIFNVQGFPTKILVDPNGIIRYMGKGESESFYTTIDKIINGTKETSSVTSSNVSKVTINAKNYPADQLLFSAVSQSGEVKKYMVNIVNGKGSVDIATGLNQTVYIQNMGKDYIITTPEGGQIMPILTKFFAEPGKEFTISFDHLNWPQIEIKGSTVNEDYSSLINLLSPLQKEERELLKKLFSSNDDKGNEEIVKKRRVLEKKIFDTEFDYLCANPSKMISAIIAKNKCSSYSAEQIERLYSLLRPYWENSEELKAISEHIKIQASVQVGKDAPVFSTVDKNGKKVSLSDYKGKYVLIDFWGTWCSPCRKSHPHLKTIFEKYNPKGLELLCVASEGKNPNQEKWLSAIKEDQLQGCQVLNDVNIETCDMVKLYNINAFPTKIVIDPAGKIAFITKGTGEAIDTFLEKTFGK